MVGWYLILYAFFSRCHPNLFCVYSFCRTFSILCRITQVMHVLHKSLLVLCQNMTQLHVNEFFFLSWAVCCGLWSCQTACHFLLWLNHHQSNGTCHIGCSDLYSGMSNNSFTLLQDVSSRQKPNFSVIEGTTAESNNNLPDLCLPKSQLPTVTLLQKSRGKNLPCNTYAALPSMRMGGVINERFVSQWCILL